MVDLRTGLTHLLTPDAADANLVALCRLRGTQRSSATALCWPWELLSGSVLPGHPVVYEQDLTDPAHPTPLGAPLTGHTDSVMAVVFSPDGRTLATGSFEGTARLWGMNVDQAIQRICATTTNTLTRAKREQYVSKDLPYRPPCP
jgi:WD40 repeat protein